MYNSDRRPPHLLPASSPPTHIFHPTGQQYSEQLSLPKQESMTESQSRKSQRMDEDSK